MKDNTSLEIIESYLKETLKGAELDEFVHRLKTDPEFANQVNDYKLAMKTVEHYGKNQMKKRLQKIFEEEKAQKSKIVHKEWVRIAAAVIVFLAIGSPFLYNYYFQRPNYNEMFTENFSLYPNVLNQRGEDLQQNLMLKEAMSYYANRDFVNACALFDELSKNQDSLAGTIEFYKGICLLGAGKDDRAANVFSNILAKPDESYKNQSRWYLALTLIKSGKQEEAEVLLKEISVTKTYNYLKAEKMLEELE